jgi:hypothetical protein
MYIFSYQGTLGIFGLKIYHLATLPVTCRLLFIGNDAANEVWRRGSQSGHQVLHLFLGSML